MENPIAPDETAPDNSAPENALISESAEPASSREPLDGATPEAETGAESRFWQTVGGGLSAAGRAIGRGAVGLGETVADAYKSIDPDLLRHIAQLPLMGLTYLTPGFLPIAQLPDDGKRVVVFIHGLAGHRGNFLPMQGYFRVMGRKRAISVGFEEKDSIQTMADQLGLLLRQVIEVNQLADTHSIDLVGHSMGGIIARLALEDPEIAKAVANLVTLGTPHSGTQLARLARSTKVLELRADSELLTRLQKQLPWPGPPHLPKLTAVWSPADMVLMPPESARVDGAHNLQVDDFSHFSYLIHPQSWKMTFDAVG